jgi:hypothetical protein
MVANTYHDPINILLYYMTSIVNTATDPFFAPDATVYLVALSWGAITQRDVMPGDDDPFTEFQTRGSRSSKYPFDVAVTTLKQPSAQPIKIW